MRQIFCRKLMTTTDYIEEARDCVLIAGGNRQPGETYDRLIWKAVERTGLPYSRLWSYLYRRVRRPTADDMDRLRAARDREKALIKERWAHVALDNDWAETVAGFERLREDVEEGAVCGGDASSLQLAPPPRDAGREPDQALGRLLDAKAHRVGAR
jgi:hypothetical protein